MIHEIHFDNRHIEVLADEEKQIFRTRNNAYGYRCLGVKRESVG